MTGRGSQAAERGLGRDFWIYFAGQTLSELGGSFTLFALPLLVYKLTHSATNLAITTVADFSPYLLFGVLIGAIVDRADRRRLMLRTDLARGLVIAVLPVIYLAGSLHVWAVYAVGFVQATLGIIFDAGEFAAIPSLVGREDLVAANGRIMATGYAGQVLGPLVAGIAVLTLPVPELFFVDAASFGVSALTLAAIKRSFNAPDEATAPAEGRGRLRSVLIDARDGLRFVVSNPVLRTISLMMALINFVGASEWSQLVLFAKRVLSATDTGVSGLYAAGAAGVVVLSLAASRIRRRLSFKLTALGALVVSGLATTAMALIGEYWPALVLWAAASGFGMLFNINTGALRQALVPPELLARVMTVAAVLAWSAIPLGALAGAAIINATGSVGAVYVGTGLLTALSRAASRSARSGTGTGCSPRPRPRRAPRCRPRRATRPARCSLRRSGVPGRLVGVDRPCAHSPTSSPASALARARAQRRWPPRPAADHSLLREVCDIALIVSVFGAGLAVERRVACSSWRLIGLLLIRRHPGDDRGDRLHSRRAVLGLGLSAAVLLGAVLAPTDPVLAGELGLGEPSEEEVGEPRLSLHTEAGANDGLAAPFLVGALLLARHGGHELGAALARGRRACSTSAWSVLRSGRSPAGSRPPRSARCATVAPLGPTARTASRARAA